MLQPPQASSSRLPSPFSGELTYDICIQSLHRFTCIIQYSVLNCIMAVTLWELCLLQWVNTSLRICTLLPMNRHWPFIEYRSMYEKHYHSYWTKRFFSFDFICILNINKCKFSSSLILKCLVVPIEFHVVLFLFYLNVYKIVFVNLMLLTVFSLHYNLWVSFML